MGDWNKDGIPDIAVGVQYDDDGGTNRGAVYVIYLNEDGSEKGHFKISDTQNIDDLNLDNSDYFGRGLAPLGDRDGDGVQDLVIGSYLDDDNGADNGSIYMVQFQETKAPGGVSANLHAWYDPGKGVSVTTIGQVDGWSDIAGGYNLAQPAASQSPYREETAMNGNPGLWFDGTNDNLESAADIFS